MKFASEANVLRVTMRARPHALRGEARLRLGEDLGGVLRRSVVADEHLDFRKRHEPRFDDLQQLAKPGCTVEGGDCRRVHPPAEFLPREDTFTRNPTYAYLDSLVDVLPGSSRPSTQVAGLLTGLQRAIRPSGRATTNALQREGSVLG